LDRHPEAAGMRGQPAQVLLAVGGVHDHPPGVRQAVEHHVIHQPAVLIRQQRVLRLPRRHGAHVHRQHRVQESLRFRPGHGQLPHVVDVEQPGRFPHRPVLAQRAGRLVLHRQFPPRKGRHAPAQRQVFIIQACSRILVSHGQSLRSHQSKKTKPEYPDFVSVLQPERLPANTPACPIGAPPV